MARVYWVTENDVYLSDGNGNRLVFRVGDNPPPEWLEKVLRIRRIIGDPIGTSLIYADALPATALENQVYTTGNGVYQRWQHGVWNICTITLDDQTINSSRGGNVWQQANWSLNLLIAIMDPLDYITSGNAGGQSVSFPSLADVLDFFNARKAAIAALAARAGAVQRVGCRPVPVGGVYE